MPRTPSALASFEKHFGFGHASILVSHIIPLVSPSHIPLPVYWNSDYEAASSFSSTITSITDEQSDAGARTSAGSSDSCTTTSQPDPVFFPENPIGPNIPLESHLLPGRGHRTICQVPALCIADQHHIEALLSSILYQRISLGILCHEPAIGFIALESGSTFELVIAWLDSPIGPDISGPHSLVWVSSSFHYVLLTLLDESQPHVHFSYPARSSATHGLFDLTCPISIFKLLSFLHGLQPYFLTGAQACQNPKPNYLFHWRFDQIANRPNMTSDWIRDVEDSTSIFSLWVDPCLSIRGVYHQYH